MTTTLQPGAGDILNDYGGIGGYEHFRPDLVLMYFVSVNPATGKLIHLQMTPMQIMDLNQPGFKRRCAVVSGSPKSGGSAVWSAGGNQPRQHLDAQMGLTSRYLPRHSSRGVACRTAPHPAVMRPTYGTYLHVRWANCPCYRG
jgi:hypothetical protein